MITKSVTAHVAAESKTSWPAIVAQSLSPSKPPYPVVGPGRKEIPEHDQSARTTCSSRLEESKAAGNAPRPRRPAHEYLSPGRHAPKTTSASVTAKKW